MSSYRVTVRLNGTITYITVPANDSARTRQIVAAQFAGAKITILETRRVA